jgi:hypothetical protein
MREQLLVELPPILELGHEEERRLQRQLPSRRADSRGDAWFRM